MEVVLSKAAARDYKHINEPLKSRISKAIDNLEKEPPEGDIKKMTGLEDTYRLRVGDFRIIYSIAVQNGGERYIIITKIAPRGEAYKD
ncbi:plasmid stabilization system protein [Campylobacterota bacterium]|nr:plasmid stabilization system protein [Campylobacterota bacterium]